MPFPVLKILDLDEQVEFVLLDIPRDANKSSLFPSCAGGCSRSTVCVFGRAGRVSCTEGVEVQQSTVFCLSETSSSVSDEEGPQLRALMVLFQVEEIDSRSYFQNPLKSDSLKVGFL